MLACDGKGGHIRPIKGLANPADFYMMTYLKNHLQILVTGW